MLILYHYHALFLYSHALCVRNWKKGDLRKSWHMARHFLKDQARKFYSSCKTARTSFHAWYNTYVSRNLNGEMEFLVLLKSDRDKVRSWSNPEKLPYLLAGLANLRFASKAAAWNFRIVLELDFISINFTVVVKS